ncbi:hypothetical protein ABPG75_013051 [Micractinium tetrahymenae]
MQGGQPRRARVYDRLEGQEPQQPPRRRFAEVDAAAEALRPGAVVALAFDCDELLAVQHAAGGSSAWSLTSACTDWSSRGTSGWHTHATDYAVESLEPSCLFRVLRDGRHIALASVAGNSLLLCATGSGDALGLVACNPGAWVGAGAAWERRDGAIFNSRWPDKALAVRVLHVTCLPTLQLQRVEEFYGGLLHEVHAEKAAALRQAKDTEVERDAALAEALTWRRQHEELDQQMQLLRERTPPAPPRLAEAEAGSPADVSAQLAALQRQLENLAAAEGSLPQLQQERARMSICLRTIKEITDLVRASATPSRNGSPSLEGPEPTAGPHLAPGRGDSPDVASRPFADDSEGESRLVDYLGRRPEEGDPLERVLDPPAQALAPPADSPHRRVLRALAENSLSSLGEADPSSQECSPDAPAGLLAAGSGPGSGIKAARPPPALPPLPLADKLSAAVRQLAVGSPHTADGVAQYIATGGNLRASQQRLGGPHRLRSSFLQRPPAELADIFYS